MILAVGYGALPVNERHNGELPQFVVAVKVDAWNRFDEQLVDAPKNETRPVVPALVEAHQ